ncbi:hypothetical protein [Pseudomonas citronellolis]|uniref:hypothetical protein n=1 Tax=Pseudomonas citronellolis TaxID=53408 RepID=UPI0023E424B5|nr:hypothetical protein [Pseudomonas citronellolis]MDF3931524.1 hypothetical protein [Pseudomonas citronellolis]
MNRKLLGLLALCAVVLDGCTPLRLYHPCSRDNCQMLVDAYYKSQAKGAASGGGAGSPAEIHYKYGFVEFDEYGNLLQDAAFENLLAEVRAIKRPVLMVVYVHGWNHSAEEGDDDVKEFKLAMRNIAAMNASDNRDVVGVYVGWRGSATHVPLLQRLTFWDRKSTAHNVGSGAVSEVLLRLDKENSRRKQAYPAGQGQDGSRLVFVGHSFGAAVLYSALAPSLIDRFVQSGNFDPQASPTQTGCSVAPLQTRTVGDLVVLINPAFEAMRFSTLHKLSQHCSFSDKQPPLIAVITGRNDWATGIAFPLARGGRAAFQKYSVYGDNHDEGYWANTKALGHYVPYLTHTLASSSSARSKGANTLEGCAQYIDPNRQAIRQGFKGYINDGNSHTLSIAPKPAVNPPTAEAVPAKPFTLTLSPIRSPEVKYPAHNPVLNILAEPPIIDGHGGIYSCELMTFVGGLVTEGIVP